MNTRSILFAGLMMAFTPLGCAVPEPGGTNEVQQLDELSSKSAPQSSAGQVDGKPSGIVTQTFKDRLSEGSMTFAMPAGFESVSRKHDANIHYAMRAKTADVEAWYTIRPLPPQIREYKKRMDNPPPGVVSQVAIHPNKFHTSDFVLLLSHIGGKTTSGPSEIKDDKAKEVYHADWIGVADVDTTNCAFAAGFSHCSIIAMHAADNADAYLFLLSNDPAEASPLLVEAISALSFKQ